MLHAPLVISTAKLDIGSLLTSSPSPPSRQIHTPATTTQPPPFSRSISVLTSTSHNPLVTSPSASSASHYSTSTVPPQAYSQTQTAPLSSSGRGGRLQTSPATSSKRGPSSTPYPSHSPARKNNKKWTARENALLISYRGQNMRWRDISRLIPGRTETSCRLRYQNYVEKDTDWSEEQKDKLARLYERLKQDLWSGIAIEMHAPWRTVESMHWQMGEEEMATRAGVRPFNRGPAGMSGGGRIIGGSSGGAGLLLEEDADEGEGWVGVGGGTERRQRRRVVLPSSAELERGVPAFAARAGMLGGSFDDEEDEDDDEEGDEGEEEEKAVFAGFRARVKSEIKREG